MFVWMLGWFVVFVSTWFLGDQRIIIAVTELVRNKYQEIKSCGE